MYCIYRGLKQLLLVLFLFFSFRSADKMFSDSAIWRSVNERDKTEIYEDVVFFLAKKEKVIILRSYHH